MNSITPRLSIILASVGVILKTSDAENTALDYTTTQSNTSMISHTESYSSYSVRGGMTEVVR